MAHLTRAQSKSEKSSSQDEPDIDDIRDNLTDSYESADLHLGDESIEEDDSLIRLSEQARRRQYFAHGDHYTENSNTDGSEVEIEEEDESNDVEEDQEEDEDVETIDRDDDDFDDHEMEGEGDDNFVANDFLRNLLQARFRGRTGDDSSENPRLDFFRAMEAFTGPGRRRTGNTATGTNTERDVDEGEHEEGEEEEDELHDFAEVVLRLMGGGIAFGGMGRESNEFLGLIENLNQRDDTYVILETLNELSERLLMMNGLTAERMVPASKLAKSLVTIMSDPLLAEELELQLVACRCLYNFLEVNQDFVHEALKYDAIPVICSKLVEITYIDLTEQALQTLEMISRDPIAHNKIVSSGGIQACLQYLDFFTTHAQRKSLTIVSNVCTNVSFKNFSNIQDSFEILTNVITNHSDAIVIEHCWLAISRIILSFKLRPEALETLFLKQPVLLRQMVQIIQQSSSKSSTTSTDESSKVSLKYGTCLTLIKSLIILASVSLEVSKILLCDCSIGQVIVKSLTEAPKARQMSFSSNGRPTIDTTSDADMTNSSLPLDMLMSAPKELLSEFLDLIGYLTPISYSLAESAFISDYTEDFDERKQLNDARVSLYSNVIKDEVLTFINQLWPLVLNAFQAEVDYEIRKKVLIIIYRIVCFLSVDDMRDTVNPKLLAVLLASITNQNNRLLSLKNSIEPQDTESSASSSPHKSSTNFSATANNKSTTSNYQLLHATFLIAKRLVDGADMRYLKEFEREGIMSETQSILLILKQQTSSSELEAVVLSKPSIATDYTNKFIDRELLKEYSPRPLKQVLESVLQTGVAFEDSFLRSKRATFSEIKQVESGLLSDVKRNIQTLKSTPRSSLEDWHHLWKQVELLCIGSEYQPSISSFELASSGLIEEFMCLLNTDNECEYSAKCQEAFLMIFHGADAAIRTLVLKLQDSLNRSESFELNTPSVASTYRTIGFGADNKFTSAMSLQIKLKISAVDGDIANEEVLHHLNNMVISVHAIATFRSIANFLDLRFHFIMNKPESIDDEHAEEEHLKAEQSQKRSIEFIVDNEVVPMEMTIYGAIYRSFQKFPDQVIDSSNIWSTLHNIQFRIVQREIEENSSSILQIIHDNCKESSFDCGVTSNILSTLKSLFNINQLAMDSKTCNSIPVEEFVNWKLTAKVNRQLEEPLVVASGTLPGWCVQSVKRFSFLFPLETRLFFLQSTSFGYSRLIHLWQEKIERNIEDNNSNSSGTRLQLGHPSRHKVRISRKLILHSAIKVLNMYGATPGILEIEYFGEVGSGMGPTLEFYASVSNEFSRKKLKMWRDDSPSDAENEYITNSEGLFPAPMSSEQLNNANGRKVLYLFGMLGKFVARALLDSRIVDFNFNPFFWQMIQAKIERKAMKYSEAHLKMVDARLASSVDHLKHYLRSKGDSQEEIAFDGCTISDLSLTFSLPGYPDYDLIPNGANIAVDQSNLEEYISRLIEATLHEGVQHQLEAFMEGFSSVFPIDALTVFQPYEIVELLGSADEDWSLQTLRGATKANHGYTKDSNAIEQLLNIMSTFSSEERRAFLQFITGSPKLPIGGFKALKPEFTVVRKMPEDNFSSDDYLPSVMTCANYLKLPEYSSEALMKRRLLQAVSEGAGEFHLS